MLLSKERIKAEAIRTGFSEASIEKVIHLLNILNLINRDETLRKMFALKGGTAFNLFIFDKPRLSVDIDLNYIVNCDRDKMLFDQKVSMDKLENLLENEGYQVRKPRITHALVSMEINYAGLINQSNHIKLDINFMFRVPLWIPVLMDSFPLSSIQVIDFPILDLHELIAGKLSALVDRQKARDFFDCHLLLKHQAIDFQKLRLAFIVYVAMKRNWRELSFNIKTFNQNEFMNNLLPLIQHSSEFYKSRMADFTETLISDSQELLSTVYPFTEEETEFLDSLNLQGIIQPSLLTSDFTMQEKIKEHPGLKWKAKNVRENQKLNHKFCDTKPG